MTTKTQNNIKLIQVQVEVDLDAPTQKSRAGLKIWRGEAATSDGYRLFFQIYEPSLKKEQSHGLKVSLK